MSMTPEIQEYYKFLLGEVGSPPGPFVLPDGLSSDTLANIIHLTLVTKASQLEDARLVQILYSAWAILNDAYDPIISTDCAIQTAEPVLRSVDSQTPAAAEQETRDEASQTVPWCQMEQAAQTDTVSADTRSAAAQTSPVKLRTKWTQMKRRHMYAAGSQTDPTPSPPPVLTRSTETQTPAAVCGSAETQTPTAVCRASETQTRTPAQRESETQTLLPRAVPGRRAAGTQTPRSRPGWAVRLVEGAPPPPAERPPEPRRFHGRRLLRRGHEAPPPEIPLSAPAPGSPPATLPADPRHSVGPGPEDHASRSRSRFESDSTGSIASSGRRSRSGSSGGEGEAPAAAPVPAPAPAPAPVPAPTPVPAPLEIPFLGPVSGPVLASGTPAPLRNRLLPPPACEWEVARRPGPAAGQPAPAAPLPVLAAPLPVLAAGLMTGEPDEEEMHLAVDSGLTASLDTSHSFLSAPPPELVARRDPRQRGGAHGQ